MYFNDLHKTIMGDINITMGTTVIVFKIKKEKPNTRVKTHQNKLWIFGLRPGGGRGRKPACPQGRVESQNVLQILTGAGSWKNGFSLQNARKENSFQSKTLYPAKLLSKH